jgi:Na+-transporting NADH:ubiquinone oxidoreductase subunit D
MAEASEGLLGPSGKKTLTDPFMTDNPITIQVLGICSALAVTVQMKPSLVMGMALMTVVVCSNVVISLLRKAIPTTSASSWKWSWWPHG